MHVNEDLLASGIVGASRKGIVVDLPESGIAGTVCQTDDLPESGIEGTSGKGIVEDLPENGTRGNSRKGIVLFPGSVIDWQVIVPFQKVKLPDG